MYTHGGPQLFSISELIEPPLKSTAHLCGMDYAGMIYTGNLSYASRPDAEKLKDMKKRALAHADRLVAVLKTLED